MTFPWYNFTVCRSRQIFPVAARWPPFIGWQWHVAVPQWVEDPQWGAPGNNLVAMASILGWMQTQKQPSGCLKMRGIRTVLRVTWTARCVAESLSDRTAFSQNHLCRDKTIQLQSWLKRDKPTSGHPSVGTNWHRVILPDSWWLVCIR